MTFDRYCKEVKEILGIESLTSFQASALMQMYLLRTPVDKAAKQLEEKIKRV